MTVYVGPSIYPYGRMIMCHMVGDDPEELHAMAERLGVRRWFQDQGKYSHYDISKTKRAVAVNLGAVEVDERRIVEVARKLWLNSLPKVTFFRSGKGALHESMTVRLDEELDPEEMKLRKD